MAVFFPFDLLLENVFLTDTVSVSTLKTWFPVLIYSSMSGIVACGVRRAKLYFWGEGVIFELLFNYLGDVTFISVEMSFSFLCLMLISF